MVVVDETAQSSGSTQTTCRLLTNSVRVAPSGMFTSTITRNGSLDARNRSETRSLADVFVDFLEMHRKGQESRILDRLDAMKIGLFS